MKLKVICIAYERPIFSRIFLDCFLIQTNPNWDMLFVHDGQASPEMKAVMNQYDDPRIKFLETEQRLGNWGHEHRRVMLQCLQGNKGDYVLITNNDNYHLPFFVDYFLKEGNNKVGFIHCDFLHHNFDYRMVVSRPQLNYIDMAAFAVELSLAQRVGFRHDVPGSDGLFAEECASECKKRGLKIVHIEKPLLVHN